MTGSVPTSPCHKVPPLAPNGMVEPLLMPQPGHPAEVCSILCAQPTDEDVRRLRQAAAGRSCSLRAPADPDGRARYRWTVGHQASFLVWRLLAHQLEKVAGQPTPAEHAIAAAARLYDVYSLLFLYTSACSRERYAATLRTDMAAHHPGFSGEWAPDHNAIPALMRQARAVRPKERVKALERAAKLNQRVHWAVAEKLVPDGMSLLQKAGRVPGKAPGHEEAELFDAFFGVQRHPVCGRTLTAQGARRAAQIMCDIVEYGLHGPDSCAPRFDASYAPQVKRLEGQAADLLLDFVNLSQTYQVQGAQ